MYVTGSMGSSQFDTLINNGGYWKLPDYLHEKFPGTIVAAVGQKSYATYTMGGPNADMRVTLSGRNYDCDVDAETVNNWRGPGGVNPPAYLFGTYEANKECSRFYIDSNRSHTQGTAETDPAWMYPLEGNRDVPGNDPEHYGGDVWSTDVALQIMDREDWSGILLTLGGIDKAGHMWGGLNDVPPYPGVAEATSHMAAQAQTADEQVGKVMDKLDELGIADDTLVVLTTDHAQLTADQYFGENAAGRGNNNWYYGSGVPPEAYLDPSPEIQRLIDETGNVRASMQDSAIRTWLTNPGIRKKRQAADVMSTLGGVLASYYRTGNHYTLRAKAPRAEWTDSEWAWWKQHGQEIVNTEAAPYGPDVIGLLEDNTSYGVKGDHGGAQKSVQQIPIVFAGPGVEAGAKPTAAIRSVDITPTILRELGIAPHTELDGRAYPLP
jgi:arylsulfatase A-like enzyme